MKSISRAWMLGVWTAVCVCPAWAEAQGVGRDAQRGPSSRGDDRRSGGGFNLQIGPGGVQFGAGTTTPHTRSHSHQHSGSNGFHQHGVHNHSQHPHAHNHQHGHNHPHGHQHNHQHHNPNLHQHQGHHHSGPWNSNVWGWNNWQSGIVVQPAPVIAQPLTPAPGPPSEPILLVNPVESPGAVSYRVNQYSYSLPPGSTQQLGGDRVWTIDFERGAGHGRQQYTLAPGRTYRFSPGPRGWELFVATP